MTANREKQMNIERTLVLIKPDAVSRGLTGKILDRYLQRSLRIVTMRTIIPTPELIAEHYIEHCELVERMERLTAFMADAQRVAIVLEGPDAISVVRRLNGKTNAVEVEPGTIRGDFGDNLAPHRTLVHASDGSPAAKRESALWFPRVSTRAAA